MTPEQIAGYVNAGILLVSAANVAVADVRQMFAGAPGMTDDALNTIAAGIQADADRRQKLAKGDAGDS